jgi:hypothetical protein
VLLDRLVWGADGWPTVATAGIPSAQSASPPGVVQQPRPQLFTDDFSGRFLTSGWNWIAARPVMHVSGAHGGRLWLAPPRGTSEAVLARQPGVTTWMAEADVGSRRNSTPGIGAFADGGHALGVEVRGTRVVAWRREGSATIPLGSVPIGSPRFVTLRITAEPGLQYSFDVFKDRGWARVAGPYPAPPWQAETRVMLHVGGGPRAKAAFERFSLGPLRR